MSMGEPPQAIEGFLDEAGPERLSGWVWWPERPQAVAAIAVLTRSGQVAARGTADLFRGDLQSAGKRDGRCGYAIDLPAQGGPFKVLATFGAAPGEAHVLADAVAGREPAHADAPGRLSASAGIVGFLDRADAAEISGWCHGPEPFTPPLSLQLVEAGCKVAEAKADRWRTDLEDVRQGDGRCGFRFELPAALHDGAEHMLELQLADGEPLLHAPFTLALPSAAPSPPLAAAPRRPAPDVPPALSIIVNFYNMRREAERTLHSLSRAFQRDLEDIAYEVLCIDNGSTASPLDEAFVESFGPEFRLVRPSAVRASPCAALNAAAGQARGRWIAVMIDGAHLLSPGALAEAHAALQASPGAIVALRQWFIGGDQRWFSSVGYSQEHEDVLFARIDWPHTGYKVFDISSPMFESPNTWFDGVSESNCLFLPAELYSRIGGFDEGFETPGAGFANLDLFRRAADAADEVVALVGEASFHQYHGGMTTNVEDAEKDVRVRAYASQYAQMRGAEFESVPYDRLKVCGGIRIGSAMTFRQRLPAPLRQGLSVELRPRPPAIQFDHQAQRYLQSAYVEIGRHRATRWRGREIGLAPTDLFDLQEALWRARPEVIVMKDTGFGLVDFVASLLPTLGLEGTRIVWVGGPDAAEPPPPRVRRLPGDTYAPEVLAAVRREIGAAEHVLAVFQPRPDDALPTAALSLYGTLVTFQSYLVVLGAAFGQPWIGYSRRWTYRAIVRFVQDHAGFVVDQTLNQHLLTTSPSGFLRRVLDPLPAERYDSALDDLSGL
jgi:cephalosporin hydroxylase/glycosyltransferase involved in cell wall biosynthesis